MTAGRFLVANQDGVYIIKLTGDVRVTLCATIDMYVSAMLSAPDFNSVVIDLQDAECIDSTTLGLLARIAIGCQERLDLTPILISGNRSIDRILQSVGFNHVFDIRDGAPEQVSEFAEMPMVQATGEELRHKVIDAHRTLMGLNDTNRVAFEDLIVALEGN